MAKVEAGDTPTGASAAVEIELKLCAEPAVLERLWPAPLLRRPGPAAPRVKQLDNVSHATLDLRLPRRGPAFRLPRAGNRFIPRGQAGDPPPPPLPRRGAWEGERP